jgi:hypothetical protein
MPDPAPHQLEVGRRLGSCEFGERVGSECLGVGPGYASDLIDPHHGGHVGDCVELREQVERVEEHRHGQAIGEGTNILRTLVNGNGDHHEPVVGQLVGQVLPPRQVVAAAAPAREGDEQAFMSSPIRKRMQGTVQVREGEVRCIEFAQRTAPALG